MSMVPEKERKEISIPLTWGHDPNRALGRVRLDSRDHVNFDLVYQANEDIGAMILRSDILEMTLGFASLKPAEPKVPSHMVEHARKELKLLGEDDVTIEWFLSVIQAYADFGHSGGSHAACLPVLIRLLEQKNLRPLTDDPEEWIHHTADTWPPAGIWQSKRNSEAFSLDDGKTYWLVSEGANDQGVRAMHESVSREG